jgi:hypothetical protein
MNRQELKQYILTAVRTMTIEADTERPERVKEVASELYETVMAHPDAFVEPAAIEPVQAHIRSWPPQPFGTDEEKVRSRELFVGNEADSDEYRETQPFKLLGYIGHVASGFDGHPLQEEFVQAVKVWVAACGGSYEGAEESHRVLELVHDAFWEAGEHPYYGDVEELREVIADLDDDPSPPSS